MELQQVIHQQLKNYCKEQPDSLIAALCEEEEGFEQIEQRIHSALENEFKNQEITTEEVIDWLAINEYGAE